MSGRWANIAEPYLIPSGRHRRLRFPTSDSCRLAALPVIALAAFAGTVQARTDTTPAAGVERPDAAPTDAEPSAADVTDRAPHTDRTGPRPPLDDHGRPL